MSGWGCPEEANEHCQRLRRPCDPGQPGCVLYGAVRFLDPAKNKPRRPAAGKLPMPGRRVGQEDDDTAGW